MLIDALAGRLRRNGAQPLLTYYDASDGSRVELSAVTFANWVDKTSNLIADLGHEDGDPIDLTLAASHPGHWVTLVWLAAAWQRGCPVNSRPSGAPLMVIGPGEVGRADLTVACSLHPLGRGFAELEDAVDYADVFAQPDLHDVSPLATGEVLDATTPPPVTPSDERLLLADPAPGWGTVVDALLAPTLGSGSAVVAVGYDREALAALTTAERATRRAPTA